MQNVLYQASMQYCMGPQLLLCHLDQYRFTLEYNKSDQYALAADFKGVAAEELKVAFWPALEKCLAILGHSLAEVSGHFVLTNNMPVGAGLGFSACVSVAIARWLCHMGWISSNTDILYGT